MLRFTRQPGRRAPGQIIVLFVLSLTAIFAMAALLFDGAHALVLRRQQQNAGDTAALQAANLIQSLKGCSATPGPPPGAPRAAIVAAAQAAVQNALPGTPASAITVSCPADWNNNAVRVNVAGHSPTYFGGAVGVGGFDVRTTSSAVNGPVAPAPFSVIVLDPYHASGWGSRNGCPSTLISGGPTIVLEGSMMIDSACPSTQGGALGTNGNSANIVMNNNAVIKIVGDYVPGALTIIPTPVTGSAYFKDPLASLPPVSDYMTGGPSSPKIPIRFTTKQVYNGGTVVLEPGVYQGGIQLRSTAKAFLHPGIYVMDGGGFDIGSQNEVYSVPAGVTTTTAATWASDCSETDCGVMIYNKWSSAPGDDVYVGAGATMKLRPYLDTVDGTGVRFADYNNLLFWQSRTPAPSSSVEQPVVTLSGGGNVDISGTVYAPGAQIYMTGGSGGSGGGTNLTLQFICWDLQIQGNSSFHFFYQNTKFAKPPDYGLVE